MSGLIDKLENLVDDLTTIEAATVCQNEAVAYSRVEATGDAMHFVGPQAKEQPNWAALHNTQIEVGAQSRAAVLALSTTLIKSLL